MFQIDHVPVDLLYHVVDAARRGRKQSREDETAELDDSVVVVEVGHHSRRDDEADGSEQDAAGAGCPLA